MGLIGVSIKGYPIFAIPKKNKIKFALAKIQASPLAKIEYDRIRWEGIGGKLGAAQYLMKKDHCLMKIMKLCKKPIKDMKY